MKILQKLKNIVKPIYTQEWNDNKEQQYWEIKCFKNGKYTHTVNMYYFTEKQIERLEKYK